MQSLFYQQLLSGVSLKSISLNIMKKTYFILHFIDATTVRKWISALLDPSVPKPKEISHLSFLVFQMQNMKISDPFDKDPPANLSDITKIFTVRLFLAADLKIEKVHSLFFSHQK